MKNLLMIVPFFPPNAGGGVYRPLGFVKYLGQYGWRPTVITMEPYSYWITDRSLVDDIPDGCDVRRTKTLSAQAVLSAFRGRTNSGAKQVRSSRGFGFLRKIGAAALVPDTYIGWYPFALRAGRRVLREIPVDAIYSTSPPETSHLVALRLHLTTGIPWVADFRDPWMNLYLLPTPTRFHRRLHEMLEKRVCRHASLVVTSPWHRDALASKYPWIGRVDLITNGYDPSHIESVRSVHPEDDRFQIVHAGMLTQKRSAVPFLKAMRIFLDEVPGAAQRCRVIFLGPRESENDAAVSELGLSSVVSFHDTAPHAETLKIERASHILVLIKHTNPLYDGIVPGKLYEYIGVERPVLALAPEGKAREIVARLARGEVVSQDDAVKIAGKIRLMYEKYLRGALETDYDLSPVPDYRRDVLAKRLAELLDTFLAERT
jgi:glycosyltransferase involved in cell wall biosynthesis